MEGKGFVYASDLEPGNILVTEAGGCVMVTSAGADETVSAENTVTVYNFEVEDWHTYYAGEWCVLVHNMCATVGADGSMTPPKNSLNNVETRQWYLEQETKIPELIDRTLPLEDQARQAFELRNQFRRQARELMADRETADYLNMNEPNLTWEQIVDRQRAKGLAGDEVYAGIINSSQHSRKSVNESLGLE